jgi:hypothetical protein
MRNAQVSSAKPLREGSSLRHRSPVWKFGLFCLAAGCFAGGAAAQTPEIAFGLGYAHVFLDGAHAGALEEQGGFHLDVHCSWPVGAPMTDDRPELRFGVAFGMGLFISERRVESFSDNGWVTFKDNYTQLLTIEPEIQLSLRQPVGGRFWLEPGLAGTFLYGEYETGLASFGFFSEGEDRRKVGGAGRAFLRGAYHRDQWSVGVEGSYSYGWLDFGDDIGGDIQQAYLGVFYARRL